MPKFKLRARKLKDKEQVIIGESGQRFILSPKKSTKTGRGYDYVNYGDIVEP